MTFGCWPHGQAQGEPLMGREATAPSIIRKIEKVQGGEQVPRNGSLALPKDVAVKPFSLKGLLNANLSVLFSLVASGSNGLLGGHSDLGGGFLGLQQHPLEGVLVVKVSTAPFRPEIEEEETPKYVEGLHSVGEAPEVVAVEVRRVVVLLKDSLAKKHKRPGDGEAAGRFPFLPDPHEGLPRKLGGRAIHEAVLCRFRAPLIAPFAWGGDAHFLDPCAHRQPVVEGEPGESANFAWVCVVPQPRDDLGDRGVAKI